jgi:serine/threonine protein kinase
MLRGEVRSAREVLSPNVCRIFDLVEEDGQELVSMEYVDGETLGETLKQRGPLALQEAREIASQFLSGLEAIHQAGLVHRDFKPENLMLTRAGRVVVMDFGLAKARTEGGRTIAGTPAYMAPEQARGEAVDARADVYAAGVVLVEMLSVGGAESTGARQALWRAVRQSPPEIPDGPWAPVLRQALAANPEERPGIRTGLGARARGSHAAAARLRDEAPLPRPRVLHRGRCGVLLRPRGRSRGGLEEAQASAHAGARRALGRG